VCELVTCQEKQRALIVLIGIIHSIHLPIHELPVAVNKTITTEETNVTQEKEGGKKSHRLMPGVNESEDPPSQPRAWGRSDGRQAVVAAWVRGLHVGESVPIQRVPTHRVPA